MYLSGIGTAAPPARYTKAQCWDALRRSDWYRRLDGRAIALALLAMQRSVRLPTMHLQHPAPECDLDYVPNRARHNVRVETLMSSSFAFGGTNAALIVRAAY